MCKYIYNVHLVSSALKLPSEINKRVSKKWIFIEKLNVKSLKVLNKLRVIENYFEIANNFNKLSNTTETRIILNTVV